MRFLDAQGFRVEVADPAGAVEGLPWSADWRASALDHDLEEMLREHAPRVVGTLARRSGDFTAAEGLDFEVGDGSGPAPGQIGLAEEDINCRCSMTYE